MGDLVSEPDSVSGALAMMHRALDYPNTADLTSLPVDAQAGALTSLEAMAAMYPAARAALLAAFAAGGGPGG